MKPSRLVIITSTLPVTISLGRRGLAVDPANEGLGADLRAARACMEARWFGWPGSLARLTQEQRGEVAQVLERMEMTAVHLPPAEAGAAFDGFAEGVLWPTCHYLLDRLPLSFDGWEAYQRVNQRFAEQVGSRCAPGDLIWIHGYKLMLLPGLLRQRLPEARIGFFLHVPFPGPEIFRSLPFAPPLLRGVLGADLIGFQTLSYLRHFSAAASHLLGVQVHADRIQIDGRAARTGIFPMGIDAEVLSTLAGYPGVVSEAQELRRELGGQRLILGIDVLDYSKGILRRLLAVERVLEQRADLRRRLRLLQLLIPTAQGTDPHSEYRRVIDEAVGRINSRFGTLSHQPIHHAYGSISKRRLVPLYQVAEIMMVTPLRDGMNLIPKEFAAARRDEDGVLILSTFAGADWQLPEALHVNPSDISEMAGAIERALDMTPEERRARMRALREHVLRYDVNRWADSYLGCLLEAQPAPGLRPEELARALRGARRRLLVLDHAILRPADQVHDLLAALTAQPDTEVHLVGPGAPDPPERSVAIADWHGQVLPLLGQLTAQLQSPPAEEHGGALRLRFAALPPERVQEIGLHLGDLLRHLPLEVMARGAEIVVRVYPACAHLDLASAVARRSPDTAILTVGDVPLPAASPFHVTDPDTAWAVLMALASDPGREA